MLEPFGPDLWLADGPVVTAAGFRYPTRMAVVRLDDGALLVWSPVALSDALRAAVEALGEVRWLIAPNTLHHVFLAEWQRAYPRARTYAPPGLRKKRADVRIGDLPDRGTAPWSAAIDHVVVAGNWITTEAVFFHAPSCTMLVADLLQQFDRGWFTGWRAAIARLDGMTGPTPSVPRKFRFAFHARRRARAALREIVAWPAERLVIAHGTPLQHGAQAAVRQAFAWLV